MKISKLKRLRCVKVKVGMERDPGLMHGNQDANKNMDDSHRQFHLSVINSGERTDLASTASFHNCNNDTSFSENNFTSINDSYNKGVGDNSSRNSSLVNGGTLFPLVQIVPRENGVVHVPGGVPENCERSNNAYRTSTESQGSQTTMLPHSSHQQLVDIESAKDACVSMKTYLFPCQGVLTLIATCIYSSDALDMSLAPVVKKCQPQGGWGLLYENVGIARRVTQGVYVAGQNEIQVKMKFLCSLP